MGYFSSHKLTHPQNPQLCRILQNDSDHILGNLGNLDAADLDERSSRFLSNKEVLEANTRGIDHRKTLELMSRRFVLHDVSEEGRDITLHICCNLAQKVSSKNTQLASHPAMIRAVFPLVCRAVFSLLVWMGGRNPRGDQLQTGMGTRKLFFSTVPTSDGVRVLVSGERMTASTPVPQKVRPPPSTGLKGWPHWPRVNY